MNVVNIQDAVKKRVEEEKKKRPPKDPGDGDGPPIQFVMDCFFANELGDSDLYNYLNSDKFAYNVFAARWLQYVGPHWEIDWSGQSKAVIESTVVQQYLRLVDYFDEKISGADKNETKRLIKQKNNVFVRIKKLRSVTGRNNCLSFARANETSITVKPDKFDTHPLLMPVENGVVDMRTGELRDGRPDDWFTKAAPTKWINLQEPCPEFKTFLRTSLDSEEKYQYMHRLLGYSSTALSNEAVFAVLLGRRGRNGKDLLMETLLGVLGDLIGPIQSEMLLAGNNQRNPSGVSPDIMSLKGRRMVWGSEVDQNTRWALGEIKRFSGGGTLKGRNPHDKEMTEFPQTHTLFQLTNYKPHAPADDNAFFERIKIISWPLSFVTRDPKNPWERKADIKLKDKLLEERSGILAWLVRGYLKYLDPALGGLNPPECVLQDTADYRNEEDMMKDFIDECCEVGPEFDEPFAALYTKYKDWWEDSTGGRKPLTKKKFGILLKDKHESIRKRSGIIYCGLKINTLGGWQGND